MNGQSRHSIAERGCDTINRKAMTTNIYDRISYHAVYDASIIEALRYANANEFAGIQIADETPHLSFERLSNAEIGKIAEYIGLEGVYATLHAPDETTSLFQCSRFLRAGVASYYDALFSFAKQIGVWMVTIHLGAMTVFPSDDETGRRLPKDDLPLYSACLRQNLEMILKLAGGKITICVENYGFGVPEFEMLKPYLGRDGLFLCWDLVKGAALPEVEACYLAHPEWIRQIHLHDRHQVASGSFRGHRTIGTGDIDFAKQLASLPQLADIEDYCIEVRPREKAKESLVALAQTIGTTRTAPTSRE
jgi:sugar phosphate isomerase/epimerase